MNAQSRPSRPEGWWSEALAGFLSLTPWLWATTWHHSPARIMDGLGSLPSLAGSRSGLPLTHMAKGGGHRALFLQTSLIRVHQSPCVHALPSSHHGFHLKGTQELLN